MYQQLDVFFEQPIGTIEDLAGRKDLKKVSGFHEMDTIKWGPEEKARPYKGFYIKRNEYGSIVELYGYHSTEPGASIFAVEPEKRRQKNEAK